MSIKHKQTKIKQTEEKIIQNRPSENLQDYFMLIVIIFVAFASFGLGRLSSVEKSTKQPISFEPNPLVASTNSLAKETYQSDKKTGSVVASKNGTKYHFPWCSGAQRIKEENKIWFDSTIKARESGYTPASNCKGLK